MVWFYTRERQSLSLETRYDNDTQEYVATIVGAAGVPETSRFSDADAFRAWLLALERELTAQQWAPDGAPHILPDGWPARKPER